MGMRNIREIGDDILRKESKTVKEMTPHLKSVLADMGETMYANDGCGLAAPQVGILKKMFVIDVSETRDQLLVMVNPEILEADGESTDMEGCLSVPGKHASVTRPAHIRVRYQDADMETHEMEADGLLARCIQHENDHLHGILYVDKKNGPLLDNSAPEEEEENDRQ